MTELVSIDARAFKKFSAAARKANPALARRMNRRLDDAANLVVADAKDRAPEGRIPGTIKKQRRAGSVAVVAGGPNAPNASPIENDGKGHVRHPVFGNMDVWTDKNSPPAFLHPALASKGDEARGLIASAVVETLAELGAEF